MKKPKSVNKSVKNIKKVLQVLESVPKSPTCTMQKLVCQPTMQLT